MAARTLLTILIIGVSTAFQAHAEGGASNGESSSAFEELITRNRTRLPQLQAPRDCQSDEGSANLESSEIVFSNGERRSIVPLGLELIRRHDEDTVESLLFYMEKKGTKWITNVQRVHLNEKERNLGNFGITWNSGVDAKKPNKTFIRSIDMQGSSVGPSACTMTALVQDSDHNLIRVMARTRPDAQLASQERMPASATP